MARRASSGRLRTVTQGWSLEDAVFPVILERVVRSLDPGQRLTVPFCVEVLDYLANPLEPRGGGDARPIGTFGR